MLTPGAYLAAAGGWRRIAGLRARRHTTKGRNAAVAELRAFADTLGLQLLGAVPTDAPTVKLGKHGDFICPHCGSAVAQLQLMRVGAGAVEAQAVNREWQARQADELDIRTVGYRCHLCEGFVTPKDPITLGVSPLDFPEDEA